MNTPTPTPRTDAAWTASFDVPSYGAGGTARAMRDECVKLERELATERARAMRDECARLERELATERARMDWCIHHNHLVMSAATGFSDPLKYQVIVYDRVGAQTFETGFFDTEREAIDAAMKEGAK